MALPIPVPLSRAAFAGAFAGFLTADTLGLAQHLARLVNVARHLHHKASQVDERAAEEMVRRMRAAAPYDTGRLHNGIRWYREDGAIVVEAIAIKPRRNVRSASAGGGAGADYAPMVDRGTRAGLRDRRVRTAQQMFSREQWFGANQGLARRGSVPGKQFRSGRRLRRAYHQHPGTAAQPFFWVNVRHVMIERRRKHALAALDAGRDAGLAVGPAPALEHGSVITLSRSEYQVLS